MPEPADAGERGAAQPPEPPLLSYTIGRLDRLVQQRLREILEPFELTVPQFTTLSVLWRRPGLSNAQLARRALILPQSMIPVITALEQRQLLVRAPDPSHNRVLRAQLTAAGEALVSAAERDVKAFEADLLDADDPATAAAGLELMRGWVRYLREA